MLTNNSQLMDGRRAGFFSNIRKTEDPRAPLASYYSSLVDLNALEVPVPSVIFTGTDFAFRAHGVSSRIEFDAVHSDGAQRALRALSNGVDVHLAWAGIGWQLSHGRMTSMMQQEFNPHGGTGRTVCAYKPVKEPDVLGLLQQLQVPLLLAPLGRMLVNCHRFGGHPLGPHRLLLRLIDRQHITNLTFNVNSGCFEPAGDEVRTQLFPFLLEAPTEYLAALLNDQIGVWEFSHHPAVRQTYVGQPTDSPLSFLASYLCPTLHPDHFERLHFAQLSRLIDQFY
ncbi:hypothetical protein [Chromobacterium sp. Panama]|uniref:hypothetical protein n=1 Tax=Chromobacterium sp. Panama TaxID=2161826 RepID=UPI001E496230|nr:hypothetical protein [Chromobacterium sp. Panama]